MICLFVVTIVYKFFVQINKILISIWDKWVGFIGKTFVANSKTEKGLKIKIKKTSRDAAINNENEKFQWNGVMCAIESEY